MQNHFWRADPQNPFLFYDQNFNTPWASMYQMFPSSSHMFYPMLHSSFNLQNSATHREGRVNYLNNYPSSIQNSFQSLPSEDKIKIETIQNCCQQKIFNNQFFHQKNEPQSQKKEQFERIDSRFKSFRQRGAFENFKAEKDNNVLKKQNQIRVVESFKQHQNLVRPLKLSPNKSNSMPIVKELTKQLMVCILEGQSFQNEMVTSIKNNIIKLTNESSRKSKKSFNELLDEVIKILSVKFSKFRKTKEEMIKYVFRKIFNVRNKPEKINQTDWKIAQKTHKRNSAAFKSMNMKYVEKEFENPIFVELFSIFLTQFHTNFKKENQDRLDRLNNIVSSAIAYEDLTELKSYKKMPWNKNIVESIQKLFEELKEIQKSATNSSNLIEIMQGEQIKKSIDDENNSMSKQFALERSKTN